MTEVEEEEFVPPIYSEAAKYKARLAWEIIGLIIVIWVFVVVLAKTDGLIGFCIIAALIFEALSGFAYVVRQILMQKEYFDPKKHPFTGGSGGGDDWGWI